MSPSNIFSQPSPRQPLGVWFGLAVAILAAVVLLSNFVDALHVSIARGEAMRAAHRTVPATDFDADKQVLAVLSPSQSANR